MSDRHLACSNLKMEVPPVGAGPAAMNLTRTSAPAAPASPVGTPERAEVSQSATDNYASVVGDLSQADIVRLIQIWDQSPSPQVAAELDDLLHDTIAAASVGHVDEALNRLQAIVDLDPRNAVDILSEPRLDPIRGNVETILNRMASPAKLAAEGRIAEAAQRWQVRRSPKTLASPGR